MKRTEEEMVNHRLKKVPEKDRGSAGDWILDKRAEGKSNNTVRCYLSALQAVSKLAKGPLTKCDKKGVQELQIAIRSKYETNPVLYCHVLRDFLTYHGREDVASFVRLNSKKSKQEYQDPEKVLYRNDIARMLSVVRDIRDKTIIAMLWDSGGRVHEIASIQIEDLTNSNGRLYTLWFRKQKVAGEERRVPLHESSKYILRWLRAHPDSTDRSAPLFPSKRGVPIHTNTIRDIVRTAGRRAKIGKSTNPHAFRHGRATDLKMRGVSDDAIRTFMGWVRDSDMPTRYISRTQHDQMNEVASKLGYEPMPEPGPVEDLEADNLLPPPMLSEDQSTDDLLNHPALVNRLDELIKARFEAEYGNWKTQVDTGKMSEAMDQRTDRISIAIKKAVQKVDKKAVVESIEVRFPEVHKK